MLRRVNFLNTRAKKGFMNDKIIPALSFVAVIMLFNQVLITEIQAKVGVPAGTATAEAPPELSVDVASLSSTAQTVAAVFPELKNAKTEEDVMRIMLPSGTPEYSKKLGGISFSNVEASLNYLAAWYPKIKEEVRKDPELWNRYMNLATRPLGISCEFCCGVGPQGVDSSGNLRCGCKHNPALHALVLGLIKYTNYSDAQILREAMKWKTAFYPKNMIAIGLQVAGKGSSAANLPSMVGGC